MMKKTFLLIFVALIGQLHAQEDLDALFDDPTTAEVQEAVTVDDPLARIFDEETFQWSGSLNSVMGLRLGWDELAPSWEEVKSVQDRMNFGLDARLWFSARPVRDFRVLGKFATSYPFKTEIQTLSDPTAPYNSVTNPVQGSSLGQIRVLELFSEFNWEQKVLFKFGKQSAAWGLSRFYQIGDPLSVESKNPLDPSVELEGPLALKAAVPLGSGSVSFWSVVKDSFLPENLQKASIKDVGIGMKGEFILEVPKNPVLGNMEATLGAFYQRDLAPKAVVGLSTGLGTFQVFTDQAFTWGQDSYRLTNELVSPGVYATEKPDEGLFYGFTAGTMYINNDWNFTLFGEYMFNSAGSSDPEYVGKWANRYFAEAAGAPGTTPTLVFSDLFSYLSQHNSGLSLGWSELPFWEKLSASAVWLQNWVDLSGMGTASLSLTPFDYFTLEVGTTLSWGEDDGEWVVKNADPVTLKPRRLSGFVNLKLGSGKF